MFPRRVRFCRCMERGLSSAWKRGPRFACAGCCRACDTVVECGVDDSLSRTRARRVRARKRIARAVRERPNEVPSDPGEELTDGDEEDAAEEAALRSGAVVRPIRDEPDELVFRFEVGPAILAQLLEKLERIPTMPLMNALGARYPGFYQLFMGGHPKYIGKTARPIGQRLKEHARKLRHRTGIDLDAISCKYAFVEDPSLVDVAEGA